MYLLKATYLLMLKEKILDLKKKEKGKLHKQSDFKSPYSLQESGSPN